MYGLYVHCTLVNLDSFGSLGVRPTPGLTSSTQVVFVCVRANTSTHTYTHHDNDRENREIYMTKPLSPPLPKHGLPRQEQSLTMNKLKKNPTSNPLPHTLAGVKKTPVIHAHVIERLDSTNKQKCAYTSAYVPPHACVYTCVCIHIHRHTYMHIHTYTHAHIHAYMHAHIHMHVYAHLIHGNIWCSLAVVFSHATTREKTAAHTVPRERRPRRSPTQDDLARQPHHSVWHFDLPGWLVHRQKAPVIQGLDPGTTRHQTTRFPTLPMVLQICNSRKSCRKFVY